MFDALLPPIYRWLRRRARLSQEGLAKDLGAGRSTIYKFEHGTKRPTPEQEARMIELAGCSDEELGERLRPEIGEALERPVGLVNESRALAREAAGGLPAGLLRVLDHEIEAVEQAALALQRAKRNLKDLAAAVEEQMYAPSPHTGATGRDVRPVFHTSGRDAGRDRETQTERKETKR